MRDTKRPLPKDVFTAVNMACDGEIAEPSHVTVYREKEKGGAFSKFFRVRVDKADLQPPRRKQPSSEVGGIFDPYTGGVPA